MNSRIAIPDWEDQFKRPIGARGWVCQVIKIAQSILFDKRYVELSVHTYVYIYIYAEPPDHTQF